MENPQPQTGMGSILLVEDDRSARQTVSRLLEREGYAVRVKEGARFFLLDVNHVIGEIAAPVHTDSIIRNVEIDLDLAPDLPPRPRRPRAAPAGASQPRPQRHGSDRATWRGTTHRAPDAAGRRAVRIAVRDQGPGIPGDKASQIFETFYTTKSDGMGMGLAISRSILEAHGGRLWAENNPGHGATFAFTFPACPPDPSPA